MSRKWKRALTFAAIAAVCTVTPTVHAELIGYWPFEDGTGKVVKDLYWKQPSR